MELKIIQGATKEQRERFLKIKEPYVKESWLRYIRKEKLKWAK